MKPRLKLAVLDLAGTTVHDPGVVEQATRQAIATVTGGNLPTDFTDRFTANRGRAKSALFLSLLGDAELAGQALALFDTELLRAVASGAMTALPGSTEALSALREQGLKIALVTGFSEQIRVALIHDLGWQDLIDLSLSPGPGVRGRPAPDLIFAALTQLDIDAVDQVAVVGDTVNDLHAARNVTNSPPHRTMRSWTPSPSSPTWSKATAPPHRPPRCCNDPANHRPRRHRRRFHRQHGPLARLRTGTALRRVRNLLARPQQRRRRRRNPLLPNRLRRRSRLRSTPA